MSVLRWTICLAGWTLCTGEIPSAVLDDALDAETCESGDCDVSLRQLRGRRIGLDQDSDDYDEDAEAEEEAAPSCANFGCDQFVKGQACQCTPQCSHFGNCCSDFKATCEARQAKVKSPTCATFGCGTKYIHHHPCQCTPKCEKFGNCCSDFKAVCILKKETAESKKEPAKERATANVTEPESKGEAPASAKAPAVIPAAPSAVPDIAPTAMPGQAEDAEGHKDWATTVDGIIRTTNEAWIGGNGKIDASMKCETAKRGDECWTAVTWAMNDGIYEHPEWWTELQPGASSFEEFQAHQHLMKPDLCPQPCMVRYDTYEEPTYRSSREYAMKGVSYGASPLKSNKKLTDDDFMTDITGAMWDSWGRGDLDVLASMGVNTLRMYGNDLNYSHRSFLDGAWKRDIDVIVGLSDWGFIQGPDPCDRHGWHCFNQVYDAYMSNLKKGFTIRNYTMYHPALKALIISNEPDLKVHPRNNVCRAMVTSLDAILQAEKDLNVTENPIALTVTYSFAAFGRQAPGLGQMEELYECMKHPERSPTNYVPKNDVLTAYKKRWVNSFNTAAPGHVVEELFLDKYAKSIFWSSEIKLPVFIGEYHSVHVGAKEDLPVLVKDAVSTHYPFYLGYNFFEFSVRYDKGGSETRFGMFGYGDCPLIEMNYSGQVYTIWNLVPARDKLGYPLAKALKRAYGKGSKGPLLRKSPCLDTVLGVS